MINLTVISNKEYENMKRKKEFLIHYAFENCPFGKCLIGLHDNCICHLSFASSSGSKNLEEIKHRWPGGVLVSDNSQTAEIVDKIFHSESDEFEVMVKGTAFEAKVWHELLNIPKGSTCSYEDVAVKIGHDKAVRAVANAIAKNNVCYLIPCHRVIRKNGDIHKYGGGSDLKKKILEFEKS